MIYWQYLFSELRRRKARSLLTAMGLGVGVALVVIVSALSNGLDNAQSEVLEPLTGVGTEMTVTRTIDPADSGGDISDEERDQLRDENRPGRVGFDNLGDPARSSHARSSWPDRESQLRRRRTGDGREDRRSRAARRPD